MKQEQVEEWAKSPVNELLIKAVKKHIEGLRDSVSACLAPYEPQKTQERIVAIEAAVDTWEDVIEVLSGDWQTLLEEEM